MVAMGRRRGADGIADANGTETADPRDLAGGHNIADGRSAVCVDDDLGDLPRRAHHRHPISRANGAGEHSNDRGTLTAGGAFDLEHDARRRIIGSPVVGR